MRGPRRGSLADCLGVEGEEKNAVVEKPMINDEAFVLQRMILRRAPQMH